MSRNLSKEWKDLHEARRLMKSIKKELDELNRLMILAWRETIQPAK